MKVCLRSSLIFVFLVLGACAKNEGVSAGADKDPASKPQGEAKLKVQKLRDRIEDLERKVQDYEKCMSLNTGRCGVPSDG